MNELSMSMFASVADLEAARAAQAGTRTCRDGGACHHSCSAECWREKNGCVPLSASGLNDDWTPKGAAPPAAQDGDERDAPAARTPGAQWREAGEPDPHGSHYDCERAQLAMGRLTDDELANGAFMNYDVRPALEQIIAGTHHSPVAWMTAVKDRIRWLSRSLEKANAALAARGAQVAPRTADAATEAFISEVRAELVRARTKFPGDRIMTIALAEEFGELCKAVLDEDAAAVRKEAVQTAVMAARVALDGDGSVREWRAERGLDPLASAQPAPRGDCPYAAPHRYCDDCQANPCPIGLGSQPAAKPTTERYVRCVDCGTWKHLPAANSHPWCGCGSDRFDWGDERTEMPT